MKRPASPTSNPPSLKAVKRTRCALACLACRKQKTRCEMLSTDETANHTCHRCQTLNIECSLVSLAQSTSLSTRSSPAPTKPRKPSYPGSGRAAPLRRSDKGKVVDLSGSGPPLAQDGLPKKIGHADNIWTFVTPSPDDPIDWSAPTVAMNELIRRLNCHTAATLSPSTSAQYDLYQLLSDAQVIHLLGLFSTHHDPWLNFATLDRNSPTTSKLDIIRCCIASRHLPISSRTHFSSNLNILAEQTVANLVNWPGHLSHTIADVQALLIWALWAPLSDEGLRGGIRDGSMVMGAAVAMAMNLRLHQVSRLISYETNVAVPEDLAIRASVWLSITNLESLVVCGTGRFPTARRSPADYSLFPESSTPLSTLRGCRETRLRILAELYAITERGTSIQFKEDGGVSALEEWNKEFDDILEQMDVIWEALAPLAAIADHEKDRFQTMKLQYHCCRIIVTYHAIFEARYANRSEAAGVAFANDPHLKARGFEIMREIIRGALRSCEAILELVILTDSPTLTSAPDSLFPQISLAACVIVAVKLHVKKHKNNVIRMMSDPLIEKVTAKLKACSAEAGEDHPAGKCAKLVESMFSAWSNAIANGQSAPDFYREQDTSMFAPALSPADSNHSGNSPQNTPSSSTTNPISSVDAHGSIPHSQQVGYDNMAQYMASSAHPAYDFNPVGFSAFDQLMTGGNSAILSADADPHLWASLGIGSFNPT